MDVEAFSMLVTKHQTGIYRYLRYLGSEPVAAEDLVQESFITAFRIRDKCPRSGVFREENAWLRAIARNIFLRDWSRRKMAMKAIGPESIEKAESTWNQTFLRGSDDGFDYLEALRRCLQGVSPKQREALDMRYSARKSRAEMASLLGMTEEGVKSLLQRVRAALADCVERRMAAWASE